MHSELPDRRTDGVFRHWTRLANAPIPNGFLVMFRISLGCCLLWQAWWYFSTDLIRNYYIAPPFHFTWYFFDWVRPWPGQGMYVHFFVLAVAATCILLGFYYRTAAVIYFLGFTYVFLLDRCWYLNHYYLICLLSFLSIFLPAARRCSLDVWRQPALRTNQAPAWSRWILQAQVGIPYFFGGIAKLNRDWLRGEPIRTWLADSSDFPLIGGWFTEEWCVYSFVYGGILIDLLAVPCLLWKRTRVAAIAVLTIFHLMNSQLFHIGVFPWMMIAVTIILYVDVHFWERFLPRVTDPAALGPTSRLFGLTLALFFLVQLVLPLRHWLIPGDVAFTREGHHFAWRMKLNIRVVDTQFFTTDPKTGERQPISLNAYLTGAQQRKLRDPHMILQLAHHLSESLSDAAVKPPIFAESTVALNLRPPSPYVNSAIDLSRTQRTLGHAEWIYPAPSEELP